MGAVASFCCPRKKMSIVQSADFAGNACRMWLSEFQVDVQICFHSGAFLDKETTVSTWRELI